MEQPVLEVRGLTKRFGDVVAVDDVSFEVGHCETVGLIGPNGAGKTTTLHMILGLVTPTRGTISILGRDPHHDRAALQDVNFSASYVSLPQTLTVWENLRVFAMLYDVPNARARAEEVLERLGIAGFRDRITRHLSSGQATMVHIAKSLLNSPKLLLLDEPTSSLDPDVADRTRALLRELALEGSITLLITSHDMTEMSRMCDRIVFIHGGRVIANDTPASLLRLFGAETLEDVFLRLAREGPS
jgi:ABC-2 type transport system ATP-binding protein